MEKTKKEPLRFMLKLRVMMLVAFAGFTFCTGVVLLVFSNVPELELSIPVVGKALVITSIPFMIEMIIALNQLWKPVNKEKS